MQSPIVGTPLVLASGEALEQDHRVRGGPEEVVHLGLFPGSPYVVRSVFSSVRVDHIGVVGEPVKDEGDPSGLGTNRTPFIEE